MTKYDLETYGPIKAIKHPEWGNGRIDFQPWPYPTATKLIIDAMNKTLVSGDTSFLKGLDPARVADELVDYSFVKNALERFPQWKNDPSVSKGDPFVREEIVQV
jgi:NitT/TauT family transport system substrate-binding protein